MRYFKIFLLVIFCGSVVACKKDRYKIFDEAAMLQFGPDTTKLYRPDQAYIDTFNAFTFVYQPETVVQDTAWFYIYTVGGKTDNDRAFVLKQVAVDGVSNAVAGTHYKAFDDASLKQHYMIKAGKVYARIPVVTFRNPSLKVAPVMLKFEIVENDAFKPGEKTNSWRKLSIIDRLVRPQLWGALEGYFGSYSEVKHQFMVDVTGKRWDQEFMQQIYPDFGAQKYYNGKLNEKLIDYNNAHPDNPLRDENNELVDFP